MRLVAVDTIIDAFFKIKKKNRITAPLGTIGVASVDTSEVSLVTVNATRKIKSHRLPLLMPQTYQQTLRLSYREAQSMRLEKKVASTAILDTTGAASIDTSVVSRVAVDALWY